MTGLSLVSEAKLRQRGGLCMIDLDSRWQEGFQGGSVVKNTHLPMQKAREMRIWSLGQEDPLEKKTATHSSTFAWKIPWTEEPGGQQSTGWQRIGHDWATKQTHTLTHTHSHTHSHTHTLTHTLTLTHTYTHTYTMRIESTMPGSSVLPGMTASRKKYGAGWGSSRQNKRGAIHIG